MISDREKGKIMELRALGYSQKEISDKTGLTHAQVNYNLQEINEEAREKGDDATFIKVLADGFLPEILEAAGNLHKLSKL